MKVSIHLLTWMSQNLCRDVCNLNFNTSSLGFPQCDYVAQPHDGDPLPSYVWRCTQDAFTLHRSHSAFTLELVYEIFKEDLIGSHLLSQCYTLILVYHKPIPMLVPHNTDVYTTRGFPGSNSGLD